MEQPNQEPVIHESEARQILIEHQIDRGMDPRTAAEIVIANGLLPRAIELSEELEN